MLHRLRQRVDGLSPVSLFFAVAGPLLIIYLITTTSGLPYHIDPLTNAMTAWDMAARRTVYFDDSPDLASPTSFGNLAWFVRTHEGHIVSQYPPGAALMAVPFYAVYRTSTQMTLYGGNIPDAPGVLVEMPSLVPASLAASVATAAAMALLALVFGQFVSASGALVAAYVAGLGTGAWAVASNSLWQHGPAMMWIALALYLTSRRHLFGAGLAFGMAILTRPHTAVIAAAVGLAISFAWKSLKPALAIGAGSLAGLASLIGYNWIVFGVPSISGGYGSRFADKTLHSGIIWYLKNIAGALVDPMHGLLIWAPFLIVLIPGLHKAWKSAPEWAKGAALGGLIYLLLQLKANRFSGGDGHFAYRYPLEMLTAIAPLLLLSWREWVDSRPLSKRLFQGGVALAVVGQLIGAILY